MFVNFHNIYHDEACNMLLKKNRIAYYATFSTNKTLYTMLY